LTNRTDLSRRSIRDLERLTRADQRRVQVALQALDGGADNLDIKALAGRSPWLRLRAGDLRILYRPTDDGRLLVGRIVNRRDLMEAVRML
jgi:mRNA-degrading endonuclease RelE of RelBE toxin-antitoxin system